MLEKHRIISIPVSQILSVFLKKLSVQGRLLCIWIEMEEEWISGRGNGGGGSGRRGGRGNYSGDVIYERTIN